MKKLLLIFLILFSCSLGFSFNLLLLNTYGSDRTKLFLPKRPLTNNTGREPRPTVAAEDFSQENISNDTLRTWQGIHTVNDVFAAYPEQIKSIFQNLNLNYPGLEEVKKACGANDIPLACKNLLSYYKKSKLVLKDLPRFSQKSISDADSILQDINSFQQVSGKVPRLADGHLKWAYTGPENDIEWAWALNRHYPVNTLLLSYFETGNPKYVNYIDSFIKDWIISSWPYPGVKSNTALWRGLEVSFRVKVWTQVFYKLMNTDLISPATQLLILSSLPEHAHYARHFHAQGNWLTMEMSGLATAAAAWPEFNNSPSWMAYTKETMTTSLMKQVYPDGVQTELTSDYHQVALDNFSLFMDVCQHAKEPLPFIYESQIEKMWNYQAYTMRPDGYGLLNNDADLVYNRDRIIQTALKYGRKDWLYIATNGQKGIRPKGQPSILFPWSGHLIMRSGFEPGAQWAFFDIGPWGTGHQHNDKLHLSISAYGRDLLVDGGRFAYSGDVAKKFRGYATGSFSHNVILIDGQGQAPGPQLATGPLSDNYFKITDKFDYSWNSFDRFINVKGESQHTRSIFYVRGKFWVVVDRISTDRPRKIEALWHWHPDCNVNIQNEKIVSTQNEHGNLEVIPVGATPWSVSLVKGQEGPQIQGWYSKEYNEYEPNTASIYSTQIKKSTTFVWVLYPSEDVLTGIKTQIQSEDKDMITLQVINPHEGRWIIKIPLFNSSKASCKFSIK